MKRNHFKMLLEIQAATELADHKLSLAMGMAPNWLCRIKTKPKWHCSAETALMVEEWHTKHCKAMNPFAKQVMDIRANSGLTDHQICQSIGVSISWLNACMSSSTFDPKTSEANKLRALHDTWVAQAA
jgi:hypothetical protein